MLPEIAGSPRFVLVHDERCPFSRAFYPPLMEAIRMARRVGHDPVVVAVDRQKEEERARSMSPTVPALFVEMPGGGPLKRFQSPRQNAETILKFMLDAL